MRLRRELGGIESEHGAVAGQDVSAGSELVGEASVDYNSAIASHTHPRCHVTVERVCSGD